MASRTRATCRFEDSPTSTSTRAGWSSSCRRASLGIHPIEPSGSGRHELYLKCDDIEQTVQQLKAKGVEFSGEITDAGFGRLITAKVPGGGELGLYRPRHGLSISLGD